MKHRNTIVLGIVVAVLIGSVPTAKAQGEYPAKTITIIVPEVPGSAADLLRGSLAGAWENRSARP